MKNIEMIRSLERSERIALRNSYKANIAALVTIKKSLDNPKDTVTALVDAIGYRPALLTIASLVNCRNDDGRLDRTVTGWASGIEDALDHDAAYELGCYTDAIHMAHLNQIAQAMIKFSPYDPTDPTDDKPTETTTETTSEEDRSEMAPDHMTALGVEMAAEYRTSSTGRSITATLTYPDGGKYRVVFSGVCGELFTACKRAAQGETVTVDGGDLLTVLETAREIKTRPQVDAAKPVDPAKQAHGEVPEKLWIGSELVGKNWRIVFDGDAGKTRVIFDRRPAQKILDAVKAAGFYWSPTMKSWNKGLTWKAYRAAQALHTELHNITNAA